MSPTITRREVLRYGGVALGGSVAGCSTLGTPTAPTVRLADATITNRLDREIDVEIHLLDGEKTAYWRRIRATASDPDTNEYGGVVLDGFPSKPGNYVLYARLPSIDEDEPVQSDLAARASEAGTPCLRVGLDIELVGASGEEHPSVSITNSLDCGGEE